jgi:hypothetical protein
MSKNVVSSHCPSPDDAVGSIVYHAVNQMPVAENREQFMARILARAAVTPQYPPALSAPGSPSGVSSLLGLWSAFLGGMAVGSSVLVMALSVYGHHLNPEQGPVVAWLQIIVPGNGLW